jgi:hypothetical protein
MPKEILRPEGLCPSMGQFPLGESIDEIRESVI